MGIDLKEHDVRFVEDNWESPTLGAAGVGWEVWLDGMEVTQFTYFQQVGGVEVKPVALELTYGLERIAMYLQNKESVYDIMVTFIFKTRLNNLNIILKFQILNHYFKCLICIKKKLIIV